MERNSRVEIFVSALQSHVSKKPHKYVTSPNNLLQRRIEQMLVNSTTGHARDLSPICRILNVVLLRKVASVPMKLPMQAVNLVVGGEHHLKATERSET